MKKVLEKNLKVEEVTSKNKVISATYDFIFKEIFFQKRNKKSIIYMLEDLIGFEPGEIKDLTLVDRELGGRTRNDRKVVLDFLALISDGTYVNIEMQRSSRPDYKMSNSENHRKDEGDKREEYKRNMAENKEARAR